MVFNGTLKLVGETIGEVISSELIPDYCVLFSGLEFNAISDPAALTTRYGDQVVGHLNDTLPEFRVTF